MSNCKGLVKYIKHFKSCCTIFNDMEKHSHKVLVNKGDYYNLGTSMIFGEGNGTPLQYSCLENPMDGGAW